VRVARAGGGQKSILREPQKKAIVEDHAVLTQRDHVFAAAHFERARSIQVDGVQKLRGIETCDFDLAER